MANARIPIGVKVAYTVWMAAWIPIYWRGDGPSNFLWLCDFANFVLLAGIWSESALLLSSQLVGVGLIQLAWAIDFVAALLLGVHPFAATTYMFDITVPVWLRGLSLFHLWTVPLLVWLLRRTGYESRGLVLQSAIAIVMLPLSLAIGTHEQNLNWVWGPFGHLLDGTAHRLWFASAFVLYPVVLFLPVDRVAARLLPRAER